MNSSLVWDENEIRVIKSIFLLLLSYFIFFMVCNENELCGMVFRCVMIGHKVDPLFTIWLLDKTNYKVLCLVHVMACRRILTWPESELSATARASDKEWYQETDNSSSLYECIFTVYWYITQTITSTWGARTIHLIIVVTNTLLLIPKWVAKYNYLNPNKLLCPWYVYNKIAPFIS